MTKITHAHVVGTIIRQRVSQVGVDGVHLLVVILGHRWHFIVIGGDFREEGDGRIERRTVRLRVDIDDDLVALMPFKRVVILITG